jgi:hypothetical protein
MPPARIYENPLPGAELSRRRVASAAVARGPAQAERKGLSAEEAEAALDLVLVDDGGGVPVADAMLVS